MNSFPPERKQDEREQVKEVAGTPLHGWCTLNCGRGFWEEVSGTRDELHRCQDEEVEGGEAEVALPPLCFRDIIPSKSLK